MKTKFPPFLKSVKSQWRRRCIGVVLLGVVVLAAWGGYFAWNRYDEPPPKPAPVSPAVGEQKLYSSQIISASLSLANQQINKQDYGAAVSEYLFAANAAYNEGDYKKSKNLLQECINKVPDTSVTWDIYRSLAAAAQRLKDPGLEKASLQKALDKTSAPGAEVSGANITYMQKRLLELNQ